MRRENFRHALRAARDETEPLTDKTAQRYWIIQIVEKETRLMRNAVETEEFQLADRTLQGCCNRQVRQCSR